MALGDMADWDLGLGVVGLDDLKCLFQPKCFCDGMKEVSPAVSKILNI